MKEGRERGRDGGMEGGIGNTDGSFIYQFIQTCYSGVRVGVRVTVWWAWRQDQVCEGSCMGEEGREGGRMEVRWV